MSIQINQNFWGIDTDKLSKCRLDTCLPISKTSCFCALEYNWNNWFHSFPVDLRRWNIVELSRCHENHKYHMIFQYILRICSILSSPHHLKPPRLAPHQRQIRASPHILSGQPAVYSDLKHFNSNIKLKARGNQSSKTSAH